MKQMIAYCGLDCENCNAYLAAVHDDQALREKTAKLWAELNQAPITPEMINCGGCRMDGDKTPYCSGICPIRKCAMKKGVEICGDYPEMERCKTVGMVTSNNAEALEYLRKKQSEQ